MQKSHDVHAYLVVAPRQPGAIAPRQHQQDGVRPGGGHGAAHAAAGPSTSSAHSGGPTSSKSAKQIGVQTGARAGGYMHALQQMSCCFLRWAWSLFTCLRASL